MTKKPSYRFAGYTESWEDSKLGECTKISAGGDIEKSKLLNNGKYPVIANALTSDGIVGYYNDSYRIEAPAVTVTGRGDVGVAKARNVNFTPVVRLLSLKSEHDVIFLENAINTQKIVIESTGVPQLTAPQLGRYKIFFPSLPEQTAIGSFFQDIDQLISLQQRKLDVLKEQKKTYLKLLFPAKGQTKPALRFAEFEDEWKEVKLGEYCCIATGKLDANAMVPDGEYDFYTSGIQKYKIDEPAFEGPAITIAGNGATVGYMHYADGQFNAYQRTYVLSNFLVDRSFIYSEIGRKLPSKIQQEARTGNIPYIVMDMLTKLDICLPSLPEQEAIGFFFQDLDKAIAKQEEKVNQLKESKQTLLRKMFI